jgi:hypothetical protein
MENRIPRAKEVPEYDGSEILQMSFSHFSEISFLFVFEAMFVLQSDASFQGKTFSRLHWHADLTLVLECM